MNTYRCMVCGYIYSGDDLPENCPICDAPNDQFDLMEEAGAGVSSKKESQEAAMDLTIDRVVILGGGIAALSAAETLRKYRDDLEILVITNEMVLPYYRLNLTKYLCNETSDANLTVHQQYWFDEQRIQVYKNKVVTEIDREACLIKTYDGMEVAYDRLIIALGAHAFIPPIKGISQEGVSTLRLYEEAAALKSTIVEGDRVLVIGGGVLGLETASALSAIGAQVTVAEGATWLMPRQLNETGAGYLTKVLEDTGIEVVYDFRTTEVKKTDQGLLVEANDGRTIEADKIVVATGVRPNTYLMRMAGLEVDRGLVVNDHMQTSDPKIYAAGDITEHYGVTYGLWPVAQYQGSIAAMNLLGIRTAFGGVPRSNALKVLDIDLFSVGEINPIDASYSVLHKKEETSYLCVVMRDQMPVGGIAIGYGDRAYKLKTLVEAKTYLSIDEAMDIDKIVQRMV